MVITSRIVLVLYIVAVVIGVAVFCLPNVLPEDGTVVQVMLGLQLTYPLFLRATAGQAWKGAWCILRIAHGMVIVLVLVLIGLAFLATPDVSGFRS